MNPNENPFHQLLLQCAKPGQEDMINVIMEEAYSKLLEGTFNPAFFEEMMPKLLNEIVPEKQTEIQEAMTRFLGHIASE